LDERVVELPSLKKDKKLPVVLSKPEVKALLIAPALLKHRLLLAITYGCGLRCSEVRNLKVKDVDLDRGMVHVRQGKGGKDRYVPLGMLLKKGMSSTWKQNLPKSIYLLAMILLLLSPSEPCKKLLERPARKLVSSNLFVSIPCVTPMPLIYSKTD
jgi:site-specific recombinase XerD